MEGEGEREERGTGKGKKGRNGKGRGKGRRKEGDYFGQVSQYILIFEEQLCSMSNGDFYI